MRAQPAAPAGLGRRPGDSGSRRPSRRFGLWLGLLALGACGSSDPPPPPPPCPTALLLGGADRISAYRPGAEARPSELRYVAALSNLQSTCRYDEDGQGVEVDLSFHLIAERGPALSDTPEEVTYFVATTAPDRRILAKDLLETELVFEEGEAFAGWSEELTLRLPSVRTNEASGYSLFVAFQLNDAQLERRRQPLLGQGAPVDAPGDAPNTPVQP